MSQKINYRRDGKRHQDNGPCWESANPMAGCNSTHVARARKKWRKRHRKMQRRIGTHMSVSYLTGPAENLSFSEDKIEGSQDTFE